MTLRHVSEFVFGDLNILWMWPCYHSNYELCLHFVYCCVYVMGTCIHSPHPFGCSKLKSNSKMHSLHSTKCTSSGWQPVCSSDWLPQCLYLSLGSTVVWVTVGNRSFAAAGPRLWNSLPVDVQSALSLTTFRQKLKTHLFPRSYPDIVYGRHME